MPPLLPKRHLRLLDTLKSRPAKPEGFKSEKQQATLGQLQGWALCANPLAIHGTGSWYKRLSV